MRPGCRRPFVPVLVALSFAACSAGPQEPPATTSGKDVGAQAADVASDTAALRAANAAAGEVVRAAGDCEAVKAALPEAIRRLEEIEGSVRTQAGRTTFEAVRKRVHDLAELCP